MPSIYSGSTQTAARFLINNVIGLDVTTLAKLANAVIIEPTKMNQYLNQQLVELLGLLPTNAVPLVIYPGNGANQLNGKLSSLQGLTSLSVTAKRHWQPGQNPVCEVEPFASPVEITHALIVDDVISSGGTVCAVRQQLPADVECWAISQVSQRFGKTRKKTLSNFSQVIVGAELCGNAVSYVPINSVSTLCMNPELAQIYAARNVPAENRKKFLALCK